MQLIDFDMFHNIIDKQLYYYQKKKIITRFTQH